MIRTVPTSSAAEARRPVINSLRGEFETTIAGELRRFDTRLSPIAAIEEACGGRAVVEVLNGVILGRRARDQIPLISAALAASDPERDDAEERAAPATVGEAEAFVLALVFALGFKVADRGTGEGAGVPLDASRNGRAGASSPSAA